MSFDIRVLKMEASYELSRAEKGSKTWFYWRGVLLGVEACDSTPMTQEWPHAVLKVNLRPA